MINPVLSNFELSFSDAFFPEYIVTKYDEYLFNRNYPFKTLISYLLETVQNISIPGLNLNTIAVEGMNNSFNGNIQFSPTSQHHVTVNRQYPGTSPINSIVDGTVVTVTFRNTLINWMYFYEMMYLYYARKRSVSDFGITLVMKDSAELPMIKFVLSDCFISTMPGLEFSNNEAFNTTKTFDIGFTFNKFDVEFLIPNFDLTKVTL